MVEFVKGVKDEVKKEGIDEGRNYFRVRPETRDGRLVVKLEVKPKEEGRRFTLKGIWALPPLRRDLWESVPDLFKSLLPARS
jgi:hypothetical protein